MKNKTFPELFIVANLLAAFFIFWNFFYYLPYRDISKDGYRKLEEIKNYNYELEVERDSVLSLVKEKLIDKKITQSEFNEIKYMHLEILNAEKEREFYKRDLEARAKK